MSSTLHRIALAAGTAFTLALAGAAVAQVDKYADSEAPPLKRDTAETARVRPLVEAEKLRPRIAGTWKGERVAVLMATGGKPPPMTAASRRLYDKRIADRKAGKTDDPLETCLPPGTPRIMLMDAPFIITQTPAKVTFFHQYAHVIRHVFLDGPLKADDLDPTWQGTSAGRWEGDTLVVETAGFNGKLWLDQAGLPQSPQMMVRERIRLVDANTLEDVLTFDDKGAYTAPWSASLRFKRLPDDTLIRDDVCGERHLDFPMKEFEPPPKGAPPR
jgi:hypothetical protein